jgi:hypothetical protein
LYAIIEYLGFVAEEGIQTLTETASEAEVTPLLKNNNGCDFRQEENIEGKARILFDNELRWPPRWKLWPCWIVQLFFLFVLWILTRVGSDPYYKPGILYVAFTFSLPFQTTS